MGGDVAVEVVDLERKVMKMEVIESGGGVEIGGEYEKLRKRIDGWS